MDEDTPHTQLISSGYSNTSTPRTSYIFWTKQGMLDVQLNSRLCALVSFSSYSSYPTTFTWQKKTAFISLLHYRTFTALAPLTRSRPPCIICRFEFSSNSSSFDPESSFEQSLALVRLKHALFANLAALHYLKFHFVSEM